MKRLSVFGGLAVSWCAIALLAACGSDVTQDESEEPTKGPNEGAPSCFDVESELFGAQGTADTAGCAGAGCHDPLQEQLDLVSPGVSQRLLGVAVGGACASTALVADSSDPEGSLVYQKVSGSTPSCGSPMPLVGAKLSGEQLACLAEYLGAL